MIRLSAAKVDEAVKSPIAAFRWSSGSGLDAEYLSFKKP
jgi:hypothetical protein